MAPFDGRYSPDLINKVSTQIDGQLPDFVADDHPVFSSFLQSYYKYLESGELVVSATIDNLLIEVETTTRLLDENADRIVLEKGTGTTGKFVVGETITGSTSKATAEVLVDDLGNDTRPRLFITSQQQFVTGETITGATSGATGTVTSYRASPVQNIQQLLAYADVDNTIYDFLEEFRKSFMNAIPSNLASGLDKRNLTKNIRELYRRKGTQEGIKLLIRILLDEEAEIFYPNTRMLRVSGGDWDKPTILRASPIGTPVHGELEGQTITGQTSGATARVEACTTFSDPSDASTIVEITVGDINGTFTKDEEIRGVSGVVDVVYKYNIRQIVSSATVSNDGILYSTNDVIDVETDTVIGSGDVDAVVGRVETGSISGVEVDDAGTDYELGDVLTFTDNILESGLVQSAVARVAVIHGSILLEDGETLLQEGATNREVEYFNIVQEDGGELFFESGNAAVEVGGINTEAALGNRIQAEASIFEERVDVSKRDDDTFILESGSGDITKVFLQDGGFGYSKLPTITITSKFGSGAKLLATTSDIGRIEDVNLRTVGFDYQVAPVAEFRANFVVKDISGTFNVDDVLTSHAGTVRAFESGTQVLTASFSDIERIVSEDGTFDNIVLDGTDPTGTFDTGDYLVYEDAIDFSGKDVSITTASASATIVNADIAKGTFNVGMKADRFGRYPDIESLIGEDLIRIQDSLYYQQFSYEVQTASGSGSYLNPLKKSVHPSGFNVFSKVKSSTTVYAGISTPTGATLGDEYVADTNTFSPILASTFEVLFDEVKRRRHQVFENPAYHIAMEDSVGGFLHGEDGEIIVQEEKETYSTDTYDLRVIKKTEVRIDVKPNRIGDSANGISFISNVTQESILGDTLALEFGSDFEVDGMIGDLLLDNTSDTLTDQDAGDRILLETVEDVNIGQGISINDYSRVTEGFNLSDLSVVDKLNITDQFDTVNILLEDSSPGSIMQEDGTTVSTTHGDEILLEQGTGLTIGGKLSLESQVIALEDETSIGQTPPDVYSSQSAVPRFARSAEVYVAQIGRLYYEPEIDQGDTQIQYETATTDAAGTNIGGNNILLESGTKESFLESIYLDPPPLTRFDDGNGTFDTSETTWDRGIPVSGTPAAATYDETDFTYDDTSETFDQTGS
jgi:hypothetical protein